MGPDLQSSYTGQGGAILPTCSADDTFAFVAGVGVTMNPGINVGGYLPEADPGAGDDGDAACKKHIGVVSESLSQPLKLHIWRRHS